MASALELGSGRRRVIIRHIHGKDIPGITSFVQNETGQPVHLLVLVARDPAHVAGHPPLLALLREDTRNSDGS